MNIIDILIAAKAKIEKPEHWFQGDYHETSLDGTIKYCAVGALLACNSDGVYDRLVNGADLCLRDAVEEQSGRRYVVEYNDADERTHAEIIAIYDRAIELAKAK